MPAACEPKPGLVLRDIKLQTDGSEIGAAHDILQRHNLPTVFASGFPKRLMIGEGLESAFTAAKPYEEDGLKLVIAQALSDYVEPAQAVEHRASLMAKLRQIIARELQERGAKPA